jgi:hypothetical protein
MDTHGLEGRKEGRKENGQVDVVVYNHAKRLHRLWTL